MLKKATSIDISTPYTVLLLVICALYITAVLISGDNQGFNRETEAWFAAPGVSMTLVFISAVGIALFDKGRNLGLALILLCWLISLFSESRNPVLIIPVLFLLFTTRLSPFYKLLIFLFILLIAIASFFTATIQENIFREGRGSIEDFFSFDYTVLKTGGRLYAWPLYIENVSNYWTGGGTSASANFGRSLFDGKWSHPHNEYIRLLFDYGIIGIILYAIPLIKMYRVCSTREGMVSDNLSFIYRIGKIGIIAYLLLGLTGNALVYSVWFGNLLFSTIIIAISSDKIKSFVVKI
jgi:hypothetical protein